MRTRSSSARRRRPTISASTWATRPRSVIPCTAGRYDGLPADDARLGVRERAAGDVVVHARGASPWPRHGVDHAASLAREGGRRDHRHPRLPSRRSASRRSRTRSAPTSSRPHRPRSRHDHPLGRLVVDARLQAAAEAAKGFMPREEGLALHDAARRRDRRSARRAAARSRHVLRQVRDLPRRGMSGGGPPDRALHGRPPPRLGGEPGGVGAPRRRRSSIRRPAGSTRCRTFLRNMREAQLEGVGRRRRGASRS